MIIYGFYLEGLNLFSRYHSRCGFRGGGGVASGRPPPPPSGIRHPANPKGPPFGTFYEIHFWPTDPKIFLKAPSAPIYLMGEREPKKRNFLVKIFQKVPKNAFLDCFFFQKFACNAESFGKIGAKQCFGRAQKRSSKFSISFWKSAPPPSRKSYIRPCTIGG